MLDWRLIVVVWKIFIVLVEDASRRLIQSLIKRRKYSLATDRTFLQNYMSHDI